MGFLFIFTIFIVYINIFTHKCNYIMFILRRINSKSIQANQCLGNDYTLVLRASNKEEFDKAIFVGNINPHNVFGVIISNQGADITPLYVKSRYYVMYNGTTHATIKE